LSFSVHAIGCVCALRLLPVCLPVQLRLYARFGRGGVNARAVDNAQGG
jgi:hypothetical protein